MTEELKSFGGISDQEIYSYILNNVQEQMKNLEGQEMSSQEKRYQYWKTEMLNLYKEQMKEESRLRKQQEIELKMAEMAEKEELILAHEKKREILLARFQVPVEAKRKEKEELDEDELEERMKNKRSIIKKKK